MKERPIIMSAESVRAILDGHKTQTRRVMKPQPYEDARQYPFMAEPKSCVVWSPRPGNEWFDWGNGFDLLIYQDCRYGQPGDRLWIKETWNYITLAENEFQPNHPSYRRRPDGVPVFAFWKADEPEEGRWHSSWFMPRWMSRLTLEITDVRVERLQDITEADAIAEGWYGSGLTDSGRRLMKPLSWFRNTWDVMHAKGGSSWNRHRIEAGIPWTKNPWVWAISFK